MSWRTPGRAWARSIAIEGVLAEQAVGVGLRVRRLEAADVVRDIIPAGEPEGSLNVPNARRLGCSAKERPQLRPLSWTESPELRHCPRLGILSLCPLVVEDCEPEASLRNVAKFNKTAIDCWLQILAT